MRSLVKLDHENSRSRGEKSNNQWVELPPPGCEYTQYFATRIFVHGATSNVGKIFNMKENSENEKTLHFSAIFPLTGVYH